MTSLDISGSGIENAYTDESIIGVKAVVVPDSDDGYKVLTQHSDNRVMTYESVLVLRDADFITEDNGPNRIHGIVASLDAWTSVEERVSVPVTIDKFVHTDSGEQLQSADLVCLHSDGINALGVATV